MKVSSSDLQSKVEAPPLTVPMRHKGLRARDTPAKANITWRIIPVSKWLITMVSPLSRVVPLPNGLNGF